MDSTNAFDITVLTHKRRAETRGRVRSLLKSRRFRVWLVLGIGYVLTWCLFLRLVIVRERGVAPVAEPQTIAEREALIQDADGVAKGLRQGVDSLDRVGFGVPDQFDRTPPTPR
jgi:hypothetical protein